VKILRGSQAKDIRPEHRENPAYGVWKELPQKEVSHRVDWCIEKQYLGLEYFGKLPLLVYPREGLAIECQTIASEWYQRAVADGLEFLLNRISEIPLGTVMAFLDQVAENGKEHGLAILESFQPKATKRIRNRINAILAEWNGSGRRMRCVFDTAWLDESLPFDTGQLFREYAKAKSILIAEWRFITREHTGMMDVEIYTSFLKDKNACFITSDRAFHNALCKEGVSSFFIDTDSAEFTSASLPGVKPRGILARLPNSTREIQISSKSRPSNPFYSAILEPLSESAQKKLRSKRRRIHNYFGGSDYIKQCGLTISALCSEKFPLVGIRLRVQSNAGIKALDATELYYWETSGDLLGTYIQAACLVIRLKLECLPLEIYYDSLRLMEPDAFAGSPAYLVWTQIISTFSTVEWHTVEESSRSPKMDELRRKLSALTTKPTNEIKEHNSLQWARDWNADQISHP
jgi:hypothetical protein